MILFST